MTCLTHPMMIRRYLLCISLILPVFLAGQERPNVIVLVADDLRAEALGAYGNDVAHTPALDRLAGQGVLFERAYVTTSICVSSRASILSGQYMRTHGIRDFVEPFRTEQLKELYPMILREHGYFTGFIGKWGVGASQSEHLEEPASQFDFWGGFVGQGEYYPDPGEPERHMTQVLTDQALDFLEEAGASAQPFCLSVSYKACHGPWDGWDRELGLRLYPDLEGMPVPELFSAEAFAGLPEFIRESIAGEQGSIQREFAWGRTATDEYLKGQTRQYYTLLSGIDRSLERLRGALEANGMADNTIILFTADQGHFRYEYGLHGKWFPYEDSIHVPFILHDPRLESGTAGGTGISIEAEAMGASPGETRRSAELVLNIDVAPTVLSLAGIEIPGTMQGADVTRLAAGDASGWRRDFLYEHSYEVYPGSIPKSIAVYDGRWKYARYTSVEPEYEQLFDTRNDPLEVTNLAHSGAHQERLQQLRARADELRMAIPDNAPDFDEYEERYEVMNLAHKPHEQPIDLGEHASAGQSFRAVTGRFHAVEFETPAWGRAYGVTDLVVELRRRGEVLATRRVPRERTGNQFRQQIVFDHPVEAGEHYYLHFRPSETIARQRLGLWAYETDSYRFGTAYLEETPQLYDLALRLVFAR